MLMIQICFIGLIIKHAVDITTRVSHNQTDFSFSEIKLDFYDHIKSRIKCVSEPLIPRVMETSERSIEELVSRSREKI